MTYENNSHQFEALNRESSLAPDWQRQHEIENTPQISGLSDLVAAQKDRARSLVQKLKSRALDITPLIAVTLVACSGGGGGPGRDPAQGLVTPPPLGGSDVIFDAATPDTIRLLTNTDGSTTPAEVGAPIVARVQDDTITYSVTGNADFTIDPISGQILYTGAAATLGDSSDLVITATPVDGGEDSAVSRTITIPVFDSATAPEFGTSSGAFTLDENATSGAIGSVTVVDPDTNLVPVVYALVGAPTGFTINTGTGAITYAGTGVDFETTSSVTLTVMATSDNEAITMDVTVAINNLSVALSGALALEENTASNADIGTIAATLSGNTVIAGSAAYALVNAPTGFTIDASTGVVSYSDAGFNFETTPTVELMVMATINGESQTQAFIVAIGDVAEAATGTVAIAGEQAKDAEATLMADTSGIADPDGGLSFTHQWQFGAFGSPIVDVAGATNATYTATAQQVGNFRVVTIATDRRGDTYETTSTNVTVGDSPPQAPGLPTQLHLITGGGATTYDLVEPATNPIITDDIATNAELAASINVDVSGASGLATYASGVLTITPGTAGTGAASGVVTITVNDGNTGPTTFTINIGVTNAADPTFAGAPTTAALGELANNGDVVATVTALDPNPGDIISGYSISDNTRFSINAAGVITYIGGGAALDFETTPSITLTVTATATAADGGAPAGAAMVMHDVVVAITNEDEAPGGAVTITGIAERGRELSADVSTITDPDGLSASVTYIYQWVRSGTDIDGASNATYTLTPDDVGNSITVRVSFTDEGTFSNSLTSVGANAVNPPAAFAAAVRAQAASPVITGDGSGGDTLDGTSASEVIQGGDGTDAITTGGGGDVVASGYGDDTVTLGAGEDIIIHRFESNSTGTWRNDDGGDIITDFVRGEDKFYLLDTNDTAPVTGLGAFTEGYFSSGSAVFQIIIGATGMVEGFRFSIAGVFDDNGPKAGGTGTTSNIIVNYAPESFITVFGATPDIVTSAGEFWLGTNGEGFNLSNQQITDHTLIVGFFGTQSFEGLRVITDDELATVGLDIA